MIRLTESLIMGVCQSTINVDLRATSNCWICEGWSEVKFLFNITTCNIPLTEEDGVLKGVNIHLDFDDYRPDVMIRSSTNQNIFSIVKMVPPRVKIRYYFSLALEKAIQLNPNNQKSKSKYKSKFLLLN